MPGPEPHQSLPMSFGQSAKIPLVKSLPPSCRLQRLRRTPSGVGIPTREMFLRRSSEDQKLGSTNKLP
eukprot:2277265-Rhodomonas_salina.2